MKIIGCGNPDRGDDRAGLLVAERLRDAGFHAETYTGEALALIDAWSLGDEVVLVDAVVTGPGTLHLWEGRPNGVAMGTPVSSHGFDIAKAIELAEALGRLPARLRVYGIEGRRFDPGSETSPEVERAVESVARQIAAIAGK